MPAEHAARKVDDIAGCGRAGLQPLDHLGVASRRHEADVLAVLLVGDRQAEAVRCGACFGLRQGAERKAHEVELVARRREQEVALVAVFLMRAVEIEAAVLPAARLDIMPGRERGRAKVPRRVEQIVELDRLVAGDAGHRRLARDVGLGEAVDHRLLEARFVVEHVVRNADMRRDRTRIMHVAAGAARSLAVYRGAVIVELQRHADDVVALLLEEGRRHRRVDAARHRDDDAGLLR